jgi:hypothetical protein
MSQSPPPSSPTSPSSLKPLDPEFAMKLNPEPLNGVRHIAREKQQQMIKNGKLYIDTKLPKGDQVIDGRGGRRRISKKRPAARRATRRR